MGMAVLSNSSFCVVLSSNTPVKLYLHGAYEKKKACVKLDEETRVTGNTGTGILP